MQVDKTTGKKIFGIASAFLTAAREIGHQISKTQRVDNVADGMRGVCFFCVSPQVRQQILEETSTIFNATQNHAPVNSTTSQKNTNITNPEEYGRRYAETIKQVSKLKDRERLIIQNQRAATTAGTRFDASKQDKWSASMETVIENAVARIDNFKDYTHLKNSIAAAYNSFFTKGFKYKNLAKYRALLGICHPNKILELQGCLRGIPKAQFSFLATPHLTWLEKSLFGGDKYFERTQAAKGNANERLSITQKFFGLNLIFFNGTGYVVREKCGDDEIELTKLCLNYDDPSKCFDLIPSVQGQGLPLIVHTDAKDLPRIDQHLNDLYNQLNEVRRQVHMGLLPKNDETLDKILQSVAEIYWWDIQAAKYIRGTSGIADMTSRTILDSFGILSPKWGSEINPDLEALIPCDSEGNITGLNEFKTKYKGLYAEQLSWAS